MKLFSLPLSLLNMKCTWFFNQSPQDHYCESQREESEEKDIEMGGCLIAMRSGGLIDTELTESAQYQTIQNFSGEYNKSQFGAFIRPVAT